jgi:hypothetical protein
VLPADAVVQVVDVAAPLPKDEAEARLELLLKVEAVRPLAALEAVVAPRQRLPSPQRNLLTAFS